MVERRKPNGIEFPPQPVRSSRARMATAVVAGLVVFAGVISLLTGRTGLVVPSIVANVSPPAALATDVPPVATLPSLDVATWVDFTSARNGLSARFPPGWQLTSALGNSGYTKRGLAVPTIQPLHDPGPTEPAVDSAISAIDGMALFISSGRMPTAMSEAAWWRAYARTSVCPACPSGSLTDPSAGCFPTLPGDYVHVVVDGQRGYEHGGTPSCPLFTEVVVLVGGRAYQMTAFVGVDAPSGTAFDQALFTAWLSTIHFDPASADDASR
jgi:hypothetical protein